MRTSNLRKNLDKRDFTNRSYDLFTTTKVIDAQHEDCMQTFSWQVY